MNLLADVHMKSAYLAALRAEGHGIERVVDTAELGPTAADEAIVTPHNAQRGQGPSASSSVIRRASTPQCQWECIHAPSTLLWVIDDGAVRGR